MRISNGATRSPSVPMPTRKPSSKPSLPTGWMPVAHIPDAIRIAAPAKVNLYLHVGHRRADGYHELDSLVVFADVGDELVFEAADTLRLAVDGPFAAALAGEPDNLV